MQELFQSFQDAAISNAIRESIWFYAWDQGLHLVSLAVFIGALLTVDLRLLGAGFSRQPLAQVARNARPWLVGGFIALFLTGLPQLLSNAMRQYYSPFFWTKMEFMAMALIFTFVIRRRVTQAAEGSISPFWMKMTGLVSMSLWAGVAIPARLIGLLS